MSQHAPLIIDIAGTLLSDSDRQRLAHPLVGGLILFARNWHKLGVAGVGTSVAFLNLSEALAGNPGTAILDVLRGGASGRLRVRANNRAYGAEGVEALGVWTFLTGRATHRLETGARLHSDFADRLLWDDTYTHATDGSATRTTRQALTAPQTSGSPTSTHSPPSRA